MKKYLISIALALLIWSCGKDTDLDFDLSGEFTGISGDSVKIIADTVGIHPFLGDKYIFLTAKEQRLLYYADSGKMYSLKAIALPESDNTSRDLYPEEIRKVMFDCTSNNFFFGYPTAIEINGKPLIVSEKRVSERITNDYSDGLLLAQDDNGDWNLTDFFKYAPYGNSFMQSRPMIAKAHDGRIVVKSNVGVLVSNGNPEHWVHHPRAFDALNNNGKMYKSLGAGLAYSAKLGFFFATGHEKTVANNIEGSIFSINPDNGETTEVKTDWIPHLIRNGIPSVIQEVNGPVFYVVDKIQSPELSTYDGYIIALSVSKDKLYQFVYPYKEGDTWDDVQFTVVLTTIQGTLSRTSPPGIIYNPEVKRFEMIHATPYELSLYSIAPDSLLNSKLNIYGRAQWKKETSLLQRDLTARAQGMHPVSSVVDMEHKVQRIFIDAGDEYPARSGIFELTRTLNTPELSDFVRKKRRMINSQPY